MIRQESNHTYSIDRIPIFALSTNYCRYYTLVVEGY